MSEIDNVLKDLKEELDRSPVIQEYLKLKEILENRPELRRMREDIARLANEKKYEERDALLAIYNSHPVVVNYSLVEEEVRALLNQIKDILSD